MAERDPAPGADITLTLDFRIQRLAEEALGDDCGAAVVLDPRNGEVLAMASSPSFDPNRFGSGMSPEEWAELDTSESHPLLNRAIQGTYPPGSVFKPVVVLAALEAEARPRIRGSTVRAAMDWAGLCFTAGRRRGTAGLPCGKGLSSLATAISVNSACSAATNES